MVDGVGSASAAVGYAVGMVRFRRDAKTSAVAYLAATARGTDAVGCCFASGAGAALSSGAAVCP